MSTNENFNYEQCKFQMKFKFDDTMKLYPRTVTTGSTESKYLEMGMYSRSDIPNYQIMTVPMAFENCDYNRFSEHYSKVRKKKCF